MKIDTRELSERKARLIISDSNPTLANALRRVLIADVPKMAIEDVEFHLGTIAGREGDENEYESTTPLFDEIIAHRLGLVPIPTDLSLYNYRDDCDSCKGEGCPNCTVIYSLNKKGPCTVYSGDLVPVGDNDLKVADEFIPIVKLTENQALLIYAIAVLGTANEHAKWQPTSGVGYKYYPDIIIDTEKCDGCGECVSQCPVNILEEKKGKLSVKDVERCKLCNICVELCPRKAIDVKGSENKFILQYETDGSLSAEEVLKQSLKILVDKFQVMIEMVEDIE